MRDMRARGVSPIQILLTLLLAAAVLPCPNAQAAHTPTPPDAAAFQGTGRFRLAPDGSLAWRLDSHTGQRCILFATEQDWRKPSIYRRGCGEPGQVGFRGFTAAAASARRPVAVHRQVRKLRHAAATLQPLPWTPSVQASYDPPLSYPSVPEPQRVYLPTDAAQPPGFTPSPLQPDQPKGRTAWVLDNAPNELGRGHEHNGAGLPRNPAPWIPAQ